MLEKYTGYWDYKRDMTSVEVTGASVSMDGLLNTLREETVDLLQKGEGLSVQMKDLHQSVDNFVQNQLDPLSSPQHTMELQHTTSGHAEYVLTPLTGEDFSIKSHYAKSGYDSGYNTTQLPRTVKVPLQKKTQKHLTCEPQTMSGEMSSGSRQSSPRVGDSRQEDIPGGSAVESLHSRLCCAQQSSKADLSKPCSQVHLGVVNPRVLARLPSCRCYDSQDISPVTVSSGYSSDKDSCVREEDIDHLLTSSGHTGYSSHSALNEDTLSCCDSELVRIYETCKELGRPLSENHEDNLLAEDLTVQYDGTPVKDTYEDLSHREFKPINYESLCQKHRVCTGEKVTSEKDCITYTPLFSQNTSFDKTNLTKGSRSEAKTVQKKPLKRHHSMFEKQSKPYICVAQSVDNRGDTVSPPPITDLPGFHPAWCGSVEDHTDIEEYTGERTSEPFGVSSASAFRPYSCGGSLTRSQSLSERDHRRMYEVPVCVRKNLAETMKNEQYPDEPVYSLVQSFPKRTLTYSCSSDSGHSSTGYCIESQSPALYSSDEGIFESPEQSVVYEPVEDDPIYEYVPNTCYSVKSQFKDTPPKLPKRNPVTRRHQQPRTGGRTCDKRTTHPVKLEDIIKPSDIVDTSGKHLYTVADVLASVEKLSEDMPAYANTTVKGHRTCDKVQRSGSYVASLSHKCTRINDDQKGLKRLFSPRLKTKRSSSCKSVIKKDCDEESLKDTSCSDACLEEKPESVHGLLVIPTHYGLQFKSSVQCTPPMKVKNRVNSGHVTPPTNCTSPAIAWNTLGSSSKEVFC